jgi:SAM-dependent methyltransferase
MMTTPPARQVREKAFWEDHYSGIQYSGWREKPFAVWSQSHPARRGALKFLGPVAGRRILCCGVAQEAVVFARAGAEVYGFDISENQVRAVDSLARQHGLQDRITVKPMPFEDLDYPAEFFDLAYGLAILHHVDLKRGAEELRRVLRPAGKAVFIEPLGMNPLLEFARRKLPYRHKHRTVDESPLTYDEIRRFTQAFSASRLQEVNLLSMLAWRVLDQGSLTAFLQRVDAAALEILPGLRRFCSQVWIGVER